VPGRRERDALLRLEAARQLKAQRGGGWAEVTVNHACGSQKALEVIFSRGEDRFDGKLLDGELVELQAFPAKQSS
jgi:hypothetical protein